MEPNPDKGPVELPRCAAEYIDQVVRQIRYRKRVRAEVHEELRAHFEDDLRDVTDPQQRETRARELIEQFGDAKLLAALCRRAKKRCRPLWQKALVRTGQGTLLVFAYMVVCTLPMSLAKPTIRVNYVEWLNNRWLPERSNVENAKRYYDEAARLYVAPPKELVREPDARGRLIGGRLDEYDSAEMRLLAQWLADNEPAFGMLRQGAKTRHYWPEYHVAETDLSDPSFLTEAMAGLAAYRRIALAFRENIAYQACQGHLDSALDDCLAVWTFGRHMQSKGLLNEQLVGIAIEALGVQSLLGILHSSQVSAATLERIQANLTSLIDPQRSGVDLDGEQVFWHDRIQRTFTDDGKGGGHALPSGVPYAAGGWWDNLLGILVLDYPDRRDAETMVQRYFEQMRRHLLLPPHENSSVEDLGTPTPRALPNTLLAVVEPAHKRLGQLLWRAKTHELATLTIVAVLRHGAERGGPPESLEQLVQAGYLDSLPDDPFGAGPLSYRKTSDGFLLYSWGENLTDDGGVQGLRQGGKPGLWADNGDWVFWPVTEAEPER